MSWHLLHCRTRPGCVLLAYAKRDLFVLCLVCSSETLRVYITWLLLAPMLSCAPDLYVLCLRSILVVYLSVGALCCLGVVVAGCWLCHFGPRLTIELPQGFVVIF